LAEVRLQKILANRGYGSRRDCEQFILDGRVKVNGKKAQIGQKADPQKDRIEFDKNVITEKKDKDIYIAFYKPRRVISDIKKADDRKVVSDFIPLDKYFFIVGRLDYDSEGLILLTNNGDLANKLTHPRYEHEKEYHVLSKKIPDKEQLEIWRRGVVIEGGYRTRPVKVDYLSVKAKNWLKVVMREGKKRQIREIGRAIGLPITRIVRKRIATLQLGALNPGEWRYLTDEEITELLNAVK
jgi:23S rRNA pseudouridine2605 synthase